MLFPKPQRQTSGEIRAAKAAVKSRDGDICRRCGIDYGLDVHELKRRGAGGRVSTENSVTLCRRCHRLIQDRLIYIIGSDCNQQLIFLSRAEYVRQKNRNG